MPAFSLQSLSARLLTVAVMTSSISSPVAAMDLADVFSDGPAEWFRSELAEGAAEDGHLETDRDSFTPATSLVGRQRSMIEMSHSYIDNRSAADSHSFPELLVRYGVTERFELRLGANYEAGGGGSVSGSDASGEEEELPGLVEEARILYGVKTQLTNQRGWLPQSATILQAATPTAGPETATQFTAAYVAGWTLPNDWMFDAAIRYGASSEEDDHFNQWAPSVVLKVPVHERWNAHVEYFGIFTQNRADELQIQYLSPGLHYLITPDCEIGFRVGWGVSDDAANLFSNLGLGVRF